MWSDLLYANENFIMLHLRASKYPSDKKQNSEQDHIICFLVSSIFTFLAQYQPLLNSLYYLLFQDPTYTSDNTKCF